MSTENLPIRLGILGLGRAFTLMVPTFSRDPRVQIVAGFDPRESSTALLHAEFGALAHRSPESLCADPNVEWVYVATPHQFHMEHVALAASYGKHVLVEKPMALALSDCKRMIQVCEQAGTRLIIGHSHSFNTPVRMARGLIESGRYGHVRMVHAMNFTDFLYRPRRPEELDTTQGGGVVFSQAAHQVDIVRLLAGGLVTSVYARTGRWDTSRPTEGAYSAILTFANGAFANLSYNGYGFFDSDALMGWVGEMGHTKSPKTHSLTRQKSVSTVDENAEASRKAERNYGGKDYYATVDLPAPSFQHFGPVIVSCDGADLQLTPAGLTVHDANGSHNVSADVPTIARSEVVDELWSVARLGRLPVHDGPWSMATMEVCLAILASDAQHRAIIPEHQVKLSA